MVACVDWGELSRETVDVELDWNDMLIPLSKDPILPLLVGFSPKINE